MTTTDRRRFLAGGLAAAGSLALGRPASPAAAYDVGGPLACMLHPVKAYILKNLPGTLTQIKAMGFQEVELISFRGFAGPGNRDGFGPLAPLRAPAIKAMIAASGLSVRSAHFKYAEFTDERIDYTLDWAADLGLRYLTIADIGPGATMDDWKKHFDRLNALGERVTRAGFQLGMHTPNEMWRRFDGVLVADAFLQAVDARACAIQLELSTAQNYGVDNAEFLARATGRVYGIHLRDAKTPPSPVNYLLAVPLGQGDLNFPSIFRAARQAGVAMYVVEMQTQGVSDPIEAIRISVNFIRQLTV